MLLRDLQQLINTKLAGEMLRFDEMIPYLDQIIDEINETLDTNYPTFSEFNPTSFPNYRKYLYVTKDPETGEEIIDKEARRMVYNNYDVFPDNYIRSVVATGAAYKWFTVDEEGISTAPLFQQEYELNKFKMLRDYLDRVPPCFRRDSTGAVTDHGYYRKFRTESQTYGVF